MKSKLLRRFMALTITVATILTALPIGVSASWKQDSKGWYNTEGNSYSIGWRQIDYKWYYFDQSGYMEHNTIIDGYYIDSTGIGVSTTRGDIPINIPYNWTKINNEKVPMFAINSKSVFVYNTADAVGAMQSNFVNAMKNEITKKYSGVQTSEKYYKGEKGTCLQYTFATDNKNFKGCSILFLKNNKAYCFSVVSYIDDFDNAKQKIDDLLNYSLVL